MLSISLLVLALVFNGLAFKKLDRFMVCLVTLALTSIHFIAFNGSEDFMYYGTATLTSLISIAILHTMKTSPLIVNMQMIYFASMCVNYYGYWIYQSGLGPIWYDVPAYCLVAAEFLRLVIVTGKDRKYGHFTRQLHISGDDRGSGKSGIRQ